MATALGWILRRCALLLIAALATAANNTRSRPAVVPPIDPPAIGLLPIGDPPPRTGDRLTRSGDRSELLHDAQPELIWAPPTHRLVMMQVTAYCPCPICCGPLACGLTASGNYIDYNRGLFVAADPMLPFGTKLIVPGYASETVEVIDRGGAIHGNRLDVFFATHEQALSWGRKLLPVTIVDE